MSRVLLYSGGLDSYVAAELWEPDVLLYVALGHRYQAQELATIAASGRDVVVDDRLYLGDLERDDAIIPLRNLYLAAIASHYGHTIALGALAGEVNPDKSHRFRREAAQVLTTCYSRSYWSAGEAVLFEYPLAGWTKVQLVARYLDRGGDGEALVARTRSCYAPSTLPCGWCSACVKRHVALTLNGLHEQTENPPATSPHLAAVVDRWQTYNPTRRSELLAAFPTLLEGPRL